MRTWNGSVCSVDSLKRRRLAEQLCVVWVVNGFLFDRNVVFDHAVKPVAT